MSNIIMSVEAMSDINDEIKNKYNIAVAPMEYMVDGKLYSTLDGMPLSEFYTAMRNGAITKTSQINTDGAYHHLEDLLKTGAQVLHFSMSSNISGTFGNFQFAARDLEKTYPGKVKIVDSLTASCGIMLLAVACAQKAKEGWSLDKLYNYAMELRDNNSALFVVDSLTYLARAGRISRATSLLGNAIHLKVALRVSEDGFLVPYKKVLSRKRAVSEIVSSTKKMFVPKFNTIYVGYTDYEDEAKEVAEELKSALNVEVVLVQLGPVVISHGGPGSLCIYFTSDTKAIKS
ncbi:MAG: DegV family protein [Clostridiales bacterium]|nr:DegV family protein [Clostridiales bacterium]